MLKHRHFGALTLAITAIALAGCTAAPAAAPAASAPPTTPAPVLCQEGEPDGAATLLGTVTDERGDYCHVTASTGTINFPAEFDDRLTLNLGVSDDTIKEAQGRAATWFIGEAADGPALEMTEDEVHAYFEKSGKFDPVYVEDYLAMWDETKTTASVVTFATTGEKVALARDGKPRVSDLDLVFTKAEAVEDADGNLLSYVKLSADLSGSYRTDAGATWALDARMWVTYKIVDRELGPEAPPAGTGLHGTLTSPAGAVYQLSTGG